MLPASIGLSVLIPPPEHDEVITATVRWADYVLDEREVEEKEKKRKIKEWRRVPNSPQVVNLPLDAGRLAKGIPIPNSDGICLVGKLERVTAEIYALAVFVVNLRAKGAKGR